nr:MAG TPA: hypothetical protein [Caudoviricetes sp.]
MRFEKFETSESAFFVFLDIFNINALNKPIELIY